MNKLELLNHLQTQVYCRLMPSPSHGVGVFAVRDIAKGTDPFPGCWNGRYHNISNDQLCELSEGVQDMVRAYCVFRDGSWCVPQIGFNRLDISFFINHSPAPNVATDDGEGFYVLQDIKRGEELFVDYNTYSEGFYLERK